MKAVSSLSPFFLYVSYLFLATEPQQRFSTPSKASAFLFVQTCLHPGNMHHLKETCLRCILTILLETRKRGLFLFKNHTGSSPLLVNDELVLLQMLSK